MPTYSPEQALARPPARAAVGRRAAGRHAVAAGRSVYSDCPTPGWPFSEGWALAQFTLGGGLLLLALSYRYWRARGARVLHAGKWLALLPVLFAVWEGLTAKTAVLPVPFFAPPQADRGAARRLAAPARQPAALPGCWGSVCCWVPAAGSSPVWPSAGRNGLATGCIRCYVCWGRCRPPRCCRCACLFFPRASAPACFDRAEHGSRSRC